MARQTEWWVVGLDKDPTPGNGSIVAGLIARMTTLADEADRARNGVVGLLRDKALDSWMGQSGDAFRQACDPLPDQLSKVRTSYDDCAAALRTYQTALDKAVQRADNGCAEALRLYHSFPAGNGKALPAPAGARDAEYHHWVAELEPPPLLTQTNPLYPTQSQSPAPSPTYSQTYPPKNNLYYQGITAPAPVWTARQQQMVNARAEVLAAVADNIAAAQACQRAIDDARRPAATIGAYTPGGSGTGGSGTQNLGMTFDERFKKAGGDLSKLVLDPSAGIDVETANLPVQGTPPDEVARWWAGLDAASRSRYIHDHAADIAGLTGIPDADRAAADAVLHPPKVTQPPPHPQGDQGADGAGHRRHQPSGGQHGGNPPRHGGQPVHDGDRGPGPGHEHGGNPPRHGGQPVHDGDHPGPGHDHGGQPVHDGDHPGPGHDPRPGHDRDPHQPHPIPGRHQGPTWPDGRDHHGGHHGGHRVDDGPRIDTSHIPAAGQHDGPVFDPSHRAVPTDTAFQHMPGPIHPVDVGQSPVGHISGAHTTPHHGAVIHDAAVGHPSAAHHPSARLGYDMVHAPSAGAWAPGLEAPPTGGAWAPGLDAPAPVGHWDTVSATGAWAPGLDATPVQDPTVGQFPPAPDQEHQEIPRANADAAHRSYF